MVRRARKPFYKDPLSIIGWGIALASIVAYWYFFVRKPVPKPGQQIARLTAVEGKVKVKPNAKEAWGDARLQDQLHVGDVVQTETRAGAEISFNSGSVVNVRPDSVVYIGGSAEASTAAWRVQSGRVNFSIGGEATEIVTPTLKTTALENATGQHRRRRGRRDRRQDLPRPGRARDDPGPEDHARRRTRPCRSTPRAGPAPRSTCRRRPR